VFGRVWAAMSRGQVLPEDSPGGGDDHVNPRGATTNKLAVYSSLPKDCILIWSRLYQYQSSTFKRHGGQVYTERSASVAIDRRYVCIESGRGIHSGMYCTLARDMTVAKGTVMTCLSVFLSCKSCLESRQVAIRKAPRIEKHHDTLEYRSTHAGSQGYSSFLAHIQLK
jgi:hypothetical protein